MFIGQTLKERLADRAELETLRKACAKDVAAYLQEQADKVAKLEAELARLNGTSENVLVAPSTGASD